MIVLLAAGMASCSMPGNSRRIPDLTESYSYKDKKPFGAFIAYRELEEMFYRNTLRIDRSGFTEAWNQINDTASLYVCVARNLYTTDHDVKAILDMAENGNQVFIAASAIDENLSTALGCRITTGLSPSMLMGKPLENTGVRIIRPVYTDTTAYRYFYYGFSRFFSETDSGRTRVLGANDLGIPNFIVVFVGKGKVFLHCEPRVFSNYFLLQRNNYRYLQELFGYCNPAPDHVYWNENYSRMRNRSDRKDNEDNSFSSLNEILKHPPLAAAFWMAIVLLLLYVAFGGKRRQRIIEELKPNENTTVTFTETIGRLYLQKKDNKNISDKMITYFNEYIRNNYFLNTHSVNSDFITTLSRKSGVTRDKVDSLYRAIYRLQNSAEVDDFQLLSLNEQMQEFYKTKR